jgi:Zn-dependent peptidase ImmA (M78 family)/transcriptional regulator with XRE-family HTH domain
MSNHKTFGTVAREARQIAALGLREAARRLRNPETGQPISPSYLSKIELDRVPPPSAALIRQMASVYKIAANDLLQHAQQKEAEFYAEDLRGSRELMQLFRLAEKLGTEQVRHVLRKLIDEMELPEDERQELKAKLNIDFERSIGQRGLFAAQIRPRVLSRLNIRGLAENVLKEHGLHNDEYKPPTRIEEIIEATDNVCLNPSDELDMVATEDGSPVVLGVTHWDVDGLRKLIDVNETLFCSDRPVDRYRLNFTLAHEYWHAIEHLELVGQCKLRSPRMLRSASYVEAADAERSQRHRNWWERPNQPRRFRTPEDWQEWQADTFAAEILMPDWHVRNEFERRFDATVARAPHGVDEREYAHRLASSPILRNGRLLKPLHEEYEVSRQSMAIRLLTLNLVVASQPRET